MPDTFIVDGPPAYAVCKSKEPFQNPFSNENLTAREKNERLRIAFGIPWLRRERNRSIIAVLRFLNEVFVLWWEQSVYPFYNRIPVEWRRKLVFLFWGIFLPLHKMLVGRRSAIHPDASLEYHALYTGMWFGRFLPITLQRLRFSLEQLATAMPEAPHPCEREIVVDATVELPIPCPPEQLVNSTANGVYLHQKNTTAPTDYVLFYFLGGAFLAGDHIANITAAETLVDGTMDVFIPRLQQGPEGNMPCVLFEICLNYRYLYHRRLREGKDPTKILLFGCSSGAAYALMLCQYFTAMKRGEEVFPVYIADVLEGLTMPLGAAFASPFVDYRTSAEREPEGSFFNYNKHDLTVNEAVQEMGMRYFETHIFPRYSPLSHPCEGLPPMCIVLSEHETVHDENILLINKIRAAGVPCHVAYFRYMCHCWCYLGGLAPEGKMAFSFMSSWLNDSARQVG